METHNAFVVKLDVDDGLRLTESLSSEVPLEHAMTPFLRDMRALARIKGRDDVVFATGDNEHPYALVHLTWNGRQASPFPYTKLCKDLAELNSEIQEALGL